MVDTFFLISLFWDVTFDEAPEISIDDQVGNRYQLRVGNIRRLITSSMVVRRTGIVKFISMLRADLCYTPPIWYSHIAHCH